MCVQGAGQILSKFPLHRDIFLLGMLCLPVQGQCRVSGVSLHPITEVCLLFCVSLSPASFTFSCVLGLVHAVGCQFWFVFIVWMGSCALRACLSCLSPHYCHPSARPQGADGGVAQPGQGSYGRGRRVFVWKRLGASSWRPRTAAGTCVQAGLAKATVHEAVD